MLCLIPLFPEINGIRLGFEGSLDSLSCLLIEGLLRKLVRGGREFVGVGVEHGRGMVVVAV